MAVRINSGVACVKQGRGGGTDERGCMVWWRGRGNGSMAKEGEVRWESKKAV